MRESLKLVQDLRRAGQLHKKLVFRTWLLTIISVLLMAGVVYDIVRYGISIYLSLGIGAVAFLLGLFVFSRMSSVEWDEAKEVINVGRMDILGVVVLIVYIGSEMWLRNIISVHYGDVAGSVGYLLMGIGASLLGRSVAVIVAVRRLVVTADEPS